MRLVETIFLLTIDISDPVFWPELLVQFVCVLYFGVAEHWLTGKENVGHIKVPTNNVKFASNSLF